MHRLAPLLAGLALVAGPACSLALERAAPVRQAGPPPPEVAVVVYNPYDLHETLVGDLLARIAPDDRSGRLRLTGSVFKAEDFAGCAAPGVSYVRCVRETLATRNAARLDGPPTVVVLITPAPGFYLGWSCVGVGADPEAGAHDSGVVWSPGADESNAEGAARCILDAAAERAG